jgi:hypothetical protein
MTLAGTTLTGVEETLLCLLSLGAGSFGRIRLLTLPAPVQD